VRRRNHASANQTDTICGHCDFPEEVSGNVTWNRKHRKIPNHCVKRKKKRDRASAVLILVPETRDHQTDSRVLIFVSLCDREDPKFPEVT